MFSLNTIWTYPCRRFARVVISLVLCLYIFALVDLVVVLVDIDIVVVVIGFQYQERVIFESAPFNCSRRILPDQSLSSSS